MRVETRVKTPEQILMLLQQNPHMTLSEVAGSIGKSVSTVERAVAKLKKQNKLVYHGPKKAVIGISNKNPRGNVICHKVTPFQEQIS